MLPTVINPEAEKIVRNAIQSLAPGLKISLLHATAAAKSTASKKPRAAASGSAQARAMEHPIVQEAQRLFNAEIRNVIDLTSND
jgi:DNA polymerase-3 subunit gamma/tau